MLTIEILAFLSQTTEFSPYSIVELLQAVLLSMTTIAPIVHCSIHEAVLVLSVYVKKLCTAA